MSVQTTASPMQLSVTWARSFSREQRLFHGLALDRVAQGPQQAARLDLALDEVVLRAFLQRLGGQRLVVEAGQHHQRDARRGRVGPPHRLQPLRVGQPEIEQDDVDGMLVPGAPRPRSCTRRASRRSCERLLVEHLAQQARVAGVVLDDRRSAAVRGRWASIRARSSAHAGSLTFVSQKSLMLFTRLSNASSCTGLVR